MSDCSDFYSRCSNYGQPQQSLSIESKDGSLRVKGKDTYHSRDWLKKHGAKFDGNDKSWVFPSTATVTAEVIRAIITDAKAERQAQIKEKRLKNLRKGREAQAARRKELNDPVKAKQRLDNYNKFIEEGGVDWKTNGADYRCWKCKRMAWEHPIAGAGYYMMNCPRCGFGES